MGVLQDYLNKNPQEYKKLYEAQNVLRKKAEKQNKELSKDLKFEISAANAQVKINAELTEETWHLKQFIKELQNDIKILTR